MKTDVPEAELGEIKQTIQASLATKAPVRRRFDTEHASLLLAARPLPAPPGDLAVWAMTGAPTDVGESYQAAGDRARHFAFARPRQWSLVAAIFAAMDKARE